jgi:outer membrane protein TolC
MRRLLNIVFLLIVASFTGYSQSPEEYYKIAAEQNPGLQGKYREFEAAMKKIPQVNSLPDPALSFGFFISPVETRVGPQRAKLSLTQMFPWYGTLEARGNAAAYLAEAKYQSFIEARNELFYKVAAAYYPIYELERWQQIEKENYELLTAFKRVATEKLENGNGALVDILRVDILMNESLSDLEILEKKAKSLLSTFNNLLNREDSARVQIPDSLHLTVKINILSKDSILANHPLIKQLELKIEASKASENVINKQAMPNIGLGLDYVIVGERNDVSLSDNGKDVIMPVISVSLPIFSKKYRAAIEEETIMQESYSFKKEDLINSLNAQYESAWFNLEQSLEDFNLYQRQVEENQRILKLLLSAYSNSGSDFEEVLDVQQKLLKYEKLLVSAMTQYNIAIARLNYITAKNY